MMMMEYDDADADGAHGDGAGDDGAHGDGADIHLEMAKSEAITACIPSCPEIPTPISAVCRGFI